MIRLLLKLSLPLILCLTILSAAGVVVGRGQSGDVFTVTSMLPPISDVGITMIDAGKRLRLPVDLPIRGVRDITLSPDGRRALLLSGGVQVRLHIYDLLTGEMYSAPDTYSLVTTPFSQDPQPEWSPDSRYVTFLNAFIPGQDAQGLYVMDFSARTTTRLHQITVAINWAQDNQRLAFAADGDVYVANILTGNVTNSTQDNRWHRLPSWAYDSSLIFAGEDFDNDRSTIFRLLPEETVDSAQELQDITPDFQAANAPMLSPDGGWMTFTGWRDNQPQLYNMFLSTGEIYPLDIGFQLRDGEDHFVSWSPDSESLLIGRNIQGTGRVSVRLSTPQGAVDTEALDEIYFIGWGVDSEYVMYSIADGRSGVFRLNLYLARVSDLNDTARVLISDAEFTQPIWGQDAGSLAYILRETRTQASRSSAIFTSRLFAMTVDGGGQYLTVPEQYAMSFAYWE
ncbi:MAG: hypothetical protein RLP44_00345 [Aggregatilineales bacterium]